MATKEVAIGKRAKISKAQQYMLVSVLGAAVVLGVAISLVLRFIQQISFNAKIIAEEESSVASYSKVIKEIGICKAPKGEIYSSDELKKCIPNDIDTADIPDTLRANILNKLADNESLKSVPRLVDSACIDPSTNKTFTYEKLFKQYSDYNSKGESDNAYGVMQLIKKCSDLRVIPDALPAFYNKEALLASVDKIFRDSGWEPESLGSDKESSDSTSDLKSIGVNLSVNADTSSTTMNVLYNLERSIREFDIKSGTIEWVDDNTLNFTAQASAYYTEGASVTEVTKTIKAEDK